MNQKTFKKISQYYLIGFLVLIGLVSMIAIITLNLTFTYPLISRHYELDVITGLDHATLLYNYRRIIHYLNWPWITVLEMPDFPMSPTGEFHFWEVMIIFQILQVITGVFLIWLFVYTRKKKQILQYFNAAANLTFIIFGLFLAIMLIDFDFFFYWFHRAFFNNDYWIFNQRYDPVILALPAELFMINGFIMIGGLFWVGILAKIRFYTQQKRAKKKLKH